MSIVRPTIKDARGRRVPLVAHEMLVPGLSDSKRRDRLQSAGWPGSPPASGRRIAVIAAALLATMAVFALGPVFLIRYFRGPAWMQTATAVLPALVSVLGSIFWMRRLAPEGIVRTYLGAGFCASCGYDIANVTRNADRTTTCPECGACWNLPP